MIEPEPLPSAEEAPRTFDARYATRVMIILAALITIVIYIEGMLTPALPTIQADFGVTTSQGTLIISAYIVTGVALMPVVGKLGDIYGKKRVLGIVLILYAICVSITGFSPTFNFMVAARAMQGIGLSVFPLGMSLVREEFPRELVPRAQAILSGMFGAGFAISLPLGAWVSNTWGWRDTYHSAIPFVVILVVLIFVYLRESQYRRPGTRVDYWGASMLGASLGLFVLALSEGPAWGWTSPATVGLLVIASALLPPLAWYERRYAGSGGEAILDLRLLRQRNVMVTNLVGLVGGLGMYLALISLSFLFQTPSPVGYHLSILGAGIGLVPLAVGMVVFSFVTALLVKRVGAKPLTAIGGMVTALGFGLVALGGLTLEQLYLVEVIMGAGIAMMNAAVINLLVLTVAPRDMGIATSMNSVFRNFGSSIGVPVSGVLISSWMLDVTIGGHSASIPAWAGFQWSFLIAAVMSVAAGVIVLFAHEVLGARPTASAAAAAPRPTPVPAE